MGELQQRKRRTWARIALIVLGVAPILMLAALVVVRLSR